MANELNTALDDEDSDDPIVHDPLLFLVTQAVHSFYGDTFPTDSGDAVAVRIVLGTGGHTHLSTMILVGRLPIEVFILADVETVWGNTKDNLWLHVLHVTGKSPALKQPDGWDHTMRLLEIREFLASQ